MSHTRVKTTYSVQGAYASTETLELYCHHNHSSDCVTFYHKDGKVPVMAFESWITGDDFYDAMERLMCPFEGGWDGGLKDKVEYYGAAPWETKNEKP